MAFLTGRKTYVLAALQSLATFAQLTGFVSPEQLATLTQALGMLFALTVGDKVRREVSGS